MESRFRLGKIPAHVMNAYGHILDNVMFVLEQNDIRYVSIHIMNYVISNHSNPAMDGNYRERLLAFDMVSGKWIAADNTTGDCFTEEFQSIERAIEWIVDEEGPADD